MFALLSHRTKRCCCAFLASEVVQVMCRPRNVSILAVSTEDPLMCYGRWSLQCQFVLSTFRDKLLLTQQSTRCSILCDDSSLSLMRPTAAMSSLNLMMRFVLCLTVQSLGSTTAPWGSSAQHDGARPRISEVSQ